MTLTAFFTSDTKPKASPHNRDDAHIALHHHYVPNFKSKSKSRAASHVMEFLSRVFSSDGASRFFKTFLLRFLFDSGSQSSDDYSTLMRMPAH